LLFRNLSVFFQYISINNLEYIYHLYNSNINDRDRKKSSVDISRIIMNKNFAYTCRFDYKEMNLQVVVYIYIYMCVCVFR